MVVGNGMIAAKFKDHATDNSVLIFASGVSNSASANENDFLREKNLLTSVIRENKEKLLIYFSTCSIYDASMSGSAYVLHKLAMEKIITENQPHYLIFRVSNPVGNTANQNTFLNFFINHIKSKTIFPVWKNAYRNIIDIDDMYKVCSLIIQNNLHRNSIINIANTANYKITEIISIIEDYFGTKGNYDFKDKGNAPVIDTSALLPLYSELNISFTEDYLFQLLNKYFPEK